MNKLRVFLAMNLPEDVRNRLAAVQTNLARSAPQKAIRWTSPEQLHLTLKFLGHLPEELVSRISSEARALCIGFKPLDLHAQRLGFFPNASQPRIIWAGVQGAGLAGIQSQLEKLCCNITGEPPEQHFKGHITLGRVKLLSRADAKEFANLAESEKPSEFGAWTAITVDLMQSQLSPNGSVCSLLAQYPLNTFMSGAKCK